LSGQDLVTKDADGEVTRTMDDGDVVYISNTASVPTLNGYWTVLGINLSNRTFIVQAPTGDDYGEITAIMENDDNAGDADQLQWNFSNFTAASDGHVSWGSMDNIGISEEIKV